MVQNHFFTIFFLTLGNGLKFIFKIWKKISGKFKFENILFQIKNFITFFWWSILTSIEHNMQFFLLSFLVLHEVLVICLNHRKCYVVRGFYPPPLFSGLTKKIASSLRVFNTFMTLVHMFCTTVVHLSVWTVLCFWTFKCDPVIWALIFVTCFCRFVPQTKVYLEIFAQKNILNKLQEFYNIILISVLIFFP